MAASASSEQGNYNPAYPSQTYLDARPTYPREWFSKLVSLTAAHSLAWDAGTGNGQAAVGVAEHYEKVTATDVSEEQLKDGIPNPRVKYLHTPTTMPEDEMVALVGGDNSVDLVIAATAVHWFDLNKFYNVVKRVLKKPGGVVAVWSYCLPEVSPEVDLLTKRLAEKAMPIQNPGVKYPFGCYKTLPFPFESVGLGREGQPVALDMFKDVSFKGYINFLSSWSGIHEAKEEGVDLLSEEVVKEFENAWGGAELVRTVNYKTYMLAGDVKA